MLEKVPGGWKIKSHTTGHLFPKVYKSKAEAEERVRQMQVAKHASGRKY